MKRDSVSSSLDLFALLLDVQTNIINSKAKSAYAFPPPTNIQWKLKKEG